MKFLAVFAFVLVSFYATADPYDSLKQKSLRYVFTINSSMSFCASCSLEGSMVALPTTIHGIQWKRLRIGAGIGYTAFGPVRSMPYFGSLTYNLYGKKRKSGIFFELNYGVSRAWLSDELTSDPYLKEVKGRSFGQLSMGYAFHYHKLRLATQIGYQALANDRVYQYGTYPNDIWLGNNYLVMPPPGRVYNYQTNRLFLNLSIGI